MATYFCNNTGATVYFTAVAKYTGEVTKLLVNACSSVVIPSQSETVNVYSDSGYTTQIGQTGVSIGVGDYFYNWNGASFTGDIAKCYGCIASAIAETLTTPDNNYVWWTLIIVIVLLLAMVMTTYFTARRK